MLVCFNRVARDRANAGAWSVRGVGARAVSTRFAWEELDAIEQWSPGGASGDRVQHFYDLIVSADR